MKIMASAVGTFPLLIVRDWVSSFCSYGWGGPVRWDGVSAWPIVLVVVVFQWVRVGGVARTVSLISHTPSCPIIPELPP